MLCVFGLVLAFAAMAAAGAGPRIAAHRGGSLLWLENSLDAYRKALALGVDYVETDVHLTADNEVVVLHDATLDRTTSGAGAVRDAHRDDLRRLQLRARDGSLTHEPIPTLGELLDVVRPSRAELLLEIKVDHRDRRYPGIEESVLALLRDRGLTARTIVMAFEAPTIERVRQLDATIRTALLVERRRGARRAVAADEAVRRTQEAGATALGISHRLLDAAVMTAARRAGIRVAAWTVNDEADLRRVIGLGVDIVISDRPDLALRLTGR
jgi:glycerophosphoryl diester phosphodiesterase